MNPADADRRCASALVLMVGAVMVGGCSGVAGGSGSGATGEPDEPATAASASAPTSSDTFDQELHDELVQMLDDDQRERAELAPEQWNDRERAERLDEILTEHGWPGFDLVGEDGEDAAWAIAQHADHDVEFQRRAVGLLRDAVEAGQGSPGNLAYLADRVELNSGGEQVYGTQLGCDGATASPAPLGDPDTVDDRRAEVGLPPLQEYLDEFADICAQDTNR